VVDLVSAGSTTNDRGWVYSSAILFVVDAVPTNANLADFDDEAYRTLVLAPALEKGRSHGWRRRRHC
jgi:hypothetical protein